MVKSYKIQIMLFSALLFLCGAYYASVAAAGSLAPEEIQAMEEQGIESGRADDAIAGLAPIEGMLLDSLPAQDVLIIPNTSNDYIGVYDPQEGTFLGIFVQGTEYFSTPVCAAEGPDGLIYATDQILDAIHVFDRQGNFLYDYADASDGLDNIRGVSFRGDHLFICTYAQGIKEFTAPHSMLRVFIPTNQSQWDITFLEDGSSLVSSSGTNTVMHYDSSGTPLATLYYTRFPEQINLDVADFNTYLNTSMTADSVRDFDISGTINEVTILDGSRGVYRLGNGNLLITNGSGVHEVDPGTNIIIETENTGANYFIELVRAPGGGGDADIDVTPASLAATVSEGGTAARDLFVANTGVALLRYGLHDDQAWIIIVSDTGNVVGGAADTVEVLFNSAGLSPGTYTGQINVTSNDPDEASVVVPCTLTVTGGGGLCDYIPGNINGVAPANGIDVTYGVTYLKGGAVPPNTCPACPQPAPFYAAMDVNGSCTTNGIDITYFVGYLKGGPALLYCPTCPPNIR